MAAFMFESSHVVESVSWPVPDKDGHVAQDWVQLQIETSQDYAHGDWMTTFLTGSLNYQAIHHVFPQVSLYHPTFSFHLLELLNQLLWLTGLSPLQVNQIYYPEIAGIVKTTCDEFGVKYIIRNTFLEAVGDHMFLLKKLSVDGK